MSQLTLKGLRSRFIPFLNLINVIAEKEEVDSKIFAAYALKLISNESRDTNTVNVCDQIISTGKFSNESKTMPLDKSTFLLDILEIGNASIQTLGLCVSLKMSIFPHIPSWHIIVTTLS